MKNIRVLVISEFTQLSTGYSIYCKNLLNGLFNRNIEVAELATYCEVGDPKIANVPWKVYPVIPHRQDPNRQTYESDPQAVFGKLAFDSVVMDFKPDYVLTICDWWYQNWIAFAPTRQLFNWIHCPTVDALEQNYEWLDTYRDCDALLTYTDFSKKVLENEGNIFAAFETSMPASEEFHPMDKAAIKQSFGLNPDMKIVGFVSRNQRRKLFGDLMEGFSNFVKKTKNEDTVLWLHTSYPDKNGFHFPHQIMDNELCSKVLFTYYCPCGHVFPSHFTGAKGFCSNCRRWTANTSNVGGHISDSEMARIYNAFDLYVQYANCFPGDQKILSSEGWKNIRDLKIDDFVYTHNGRYKKILNTFKRKIDEQILYIKPFCSLNDIKCTKEHPILVYDIINDKKKNQKRLCTARSILGLLERQGKELPKPVYKMAKELKPGDLLIEIIDDSIIDIEKIDLADFAKDTDTINETTIKVSHGGTYNRYLDIDEDFLKFIGLFAADGHAHKNSKSLRITAETTDEENISLAIRVIEKITGKSPYIYKYPHKKAIDICGACVLLFNAFRKWFYQENKQKKLPEWVLNLPKEKQTHTIQGMFSGDGYCSERVSSYSTISKELIENLTFLLRRNRIGYGEYYLHKKGQYILEVFGNVKKIGVQSLKTNTKNMYLNNCYLRQIKTIEEIHFSGDVFNIEVEEDNSYSTKIGIVHNCEGLGAGQLQAAACGVPICSVNYSAMEDVTTKLEGYKVEPLALVEEIETGCLRAVPNNDQLTDILEEFFDLPKTIRKLKGEETRNNYTNWYSWDKTVDRWLEVMYSTPKKNGRLIIKEPAKLTDDILTRTSNPEYVKWLLSEVLCMPEKLGTYLELKFIRDLQHGSTACLPSFYFVEDSMAFTGGERKGFSRHDAYEFCLGLRLKNNQFTKEMRNLNAVDNL